MLTGTPLQVQTGQQILRYISRTPPFNDLQTWISGSNDYCYSPDPDLNMYLLFGGIEVADPGYLVRKQNDLLEPWVF